MLLTFDNSNVNPSFAISFYLYLFGMTFQSGMKTKKNVIFIGVSYKYFVLDQLLNIFIFFDKNLSIWKKIRMTQK